LCEIGDLIAQEKLTNHGGRESGESHNVIVPTESAS
jgi:hypothetical protein